MSEWIEWKGGECPVKVGTLIDVKYRNGFMASQQVAGAARSGAEYWTHAGRSRDIIAYRLHVQQHPANSRQVAGTHYKDMGVEPWDVVDTWPLEQRIGAYRHGALKYLMRMGSKDESAQEIAKGIHYMEKLLEVLKEK
jgi:hypothetical protein